MARSETTRSLGSCLHLEIKAIVMAGFTCGDDLRSPIKTINLLPEIFFLVFNFFFLKNSTHCLVGNIFHVKHFLWKRSYMEYYTHCLVGLRILKYFPPSMDKKIPNKC